MTGPPGPVITAEDVWGAAFDDLATTHDVRRLRDPRSEPETLARASALVVRNRTRVDADLMAAAPRLRVVARAGAGLDNIDVAAADRAGVVVTAAPGANATSVAEHTVLLALAVLRDLPAHDRAVRGGEWRRAPGRELSGRTWGILGMGATGRAVSRLLRGFGVTVIGHDPFVPADLEMVPLGELAARSDVLSVHLPATDRTRGLVDARLLGRMPHGAVLVNVGRGEAVDEAALADALRSGALAGAGLDVRVDEPPPQGLLEGLDRVVSTPHVAGVTEESQRRIADMLVADISAVLAGGSATAAVGTVAG